MGGSWELFKVFMMLFACMDMDLNPLCNPHKTRGEFQGVASLAIYGAEGGSAFIWLTGPPRNPYPGS
jgi:hypothetical protein